MAARVNELELALASVSRDLEALGVRWALVGGLAVSARAEPRTTRDVDVAVAVEDDEAAEALVHALSTLGYQVLATVEQTAAARLATARLRNPGAGRVVLDLLFASSGIEPEIVSAAERIAIVPGLELPVATTAHLIAMKVLARDDRHRPQDADDLRALIREADEGSLREARRALTLITTRGYHRTLDLDAALSEALDDLT